MLSAIPNAIGALCLNQAGIDFTLEHKDLLGAYVRAATKDDHSLNLGSHLDELVRHHPQLRKCVLDNILDLLRSQIEQARTFVPSEEDRPRYLLDVSDVVGHSDKQVDNDHMKELTRTLNVSPIADSQLMSSCCKVYSGTVRSPPISRLQGVC